METKLTGLAGVIMVCQQLLGFLIVSGISLTPAGVDFAVNCILVWPGPFTL